MKISSSILGIKNDIQKIKLLSNTETDYIHLDVMDGIFVDNCVLNYEECLEISKVINKPLDIHLMVDSPKKYIDNFKELNPIYITFHYEINDNIDELISYIKNLNIKVGLSIKPQTDIKNIYKYLDKVDMILIMSVNPGYGGQAFISSTNDRINELYNFRKDNNLKFLIEVDGGINEINIKNLKCDIAVVGSYITNSENYQEQIKKIGG